MVAPSVSLSKKRGFNHGPQRGMSEQFLGAWVRFLWSQVGEDGKNSRFNFFTQGSMVESL